MDMLLLERESGRRQQERLREAEHQCLVSGQRAELERLARQQARQLAAARGRRAAVSGVGVILASAALVLGGNSLGLMC